LAARGRDNGGNMALAARGGGSGDDMVLTNPIIEWGEVHTL
jgi:hypothetical protein